MSENNYGALMMKSAISASIDINGLMSPGIYSVPPDNPSSPHPDGGTLTIYPGSVKLRSFLSNTKNYASSSYATSSSSWGPWYFSVTHNELIAQDGAKLIGGLNYVTPEMSGFVTGVGNADADTAAIQWALNQNAAKI
ncbi:TPA: hypothetical protein QFT68_005755, partial [Raoultella ornithinolytica]|nr:hypothetical protein [Raoultella ornithinolytica]